MAEVNNLTALPRDRAGKGSARAVRREGQIPAVIYGNKLEPLSISIPRRELDQELHKAGFYIRLMDISLDGETHRVLPRDVQFHPVSDAPLHVDFLRFSRDRKITAAVPVTFENEEESPGLVRGGVLNVVRFEVEVLCIADSIPQSLTADLSGLDIGDGIHASSVKLPDEVEFTITDRDFTIATIAAPTIVVDEAAEAAEAAEGEEGAEGVEGAEGEGAAEGDEAKPADGEGGGD